MAHPKPDNEKVVRATLRHPMKIRIGYYCKHTVQDAYNEKQES